MSEIMAEIGLPSDIMAQLELSRWNSLSDAERQQLAEILTERLNTEGYRLTAPCFEQHGPEGEQTVLLWHDALSGLYFTLIPGGTLLPGYDKAQLERYAHIYDMVEGWRSQEEAFANWEPEKPEETWIRCSDIPCDIRRKPPVSIEPFLMAEFPALARTSEIRRLVPEPYLWYETWEETARAGLPVLMRWSQVDAVLKHYGWDVPTSVEFEWALSGGIPGLFYWGDDLPAFVLVSPYDKDENPEARYENVEGVTAAVGFKHIMLSDNPTERLPRWPYWNRFGLLGMLVWGTWCASSTVVADPYPLIFRGGAAVSYPWQSCGEWKTLLSAVEGRLSKESKQWEWNALRPVIRLREER